MMYKDDRTPEQMQTHVWLVTATDRFMSGWGPCRGGVSKCAWACTPEQLDRVLAWVQSRKEMKYVNYHRAESYRPRNCKHFHIYAVTETHPAI
jgi:hypothetical protein